MSADATSDAQPGDVPILSVGGTIGGLDEKEVRKVIHGAWPEVNRCLREGRKKLPFLGGNIGVSVTVGSTGRADEVFLQESTLGEHGVETCIVKAFRAPQWPRPVGGKVGKVEQSFELTSGHADPPLSWTPAELQRRMAKEAEGDERPFDELLTTLRACKSDAGAGPLRVTMYLDEDGFVQGLGVAMSDFAGHQAVDCITTAMKTTSFPAPEDNFAKVTLEVK